MSGRNTDRSSKDQNPLQPDATSKKAASEFDNISNAEKTVEDDGFSGNSPQKGSNTEFKLNPMVLMSKMGPVPQYSHKSKTKDQNSKNGIDAMSKKAASQFDNISKAEEIEKNVEDVGLSGVSPPKGPMLLMSKMGPVPQYSHKSMAKDLNSQNVIEASLGPSSKFNLPSADVPQDPFATGLDLGEIIGSAAVQDQDITQMNREPGLEGSGGGFALMSSSHNTHQYLGDDMKISPIATVQSERIVSVQQPQVQIESSVKQSVKKSAPSVLKQSVPFVNSKETRKEDVTNMVHHKHVENKQENTRKACLEQYGALYPDLIASAEQNWLVVVLFIASILSVLAFLSYQNASSGKASSGGLIENGALLLTISTGFFGLYILNLTCWGLPSGHSGIEENVDASDEYGSSEGTMKVNLRRVNSKKMSTRKIYYNEATSSSGASDNIDSYEKRSFVKEESNSPNMKPCQKISFCLSMVASCMIAFGGIGLYLCGYQAVEHSRMTGSQNQFMGSENTPIMLCGWSMIIFSIYMLWTREPPKVERVTSL